ncbi:MAG TPA: Flp family type IVb pilin [Microvirga sp.]|nr:Flp family type IVb pilin [Microvirga sp.]
MKSLVNRFRKNESGATAIEYGLIAALIAVLIIGALQISGSQLQIAFNKVATALTNANAASSGSGGSSGGASGGSSS